MVFNFIPIISVTGVLVICILVRCLFLCFIFLISSFRCMYFVIAVPLSPPIACDLLDLFTILNHQSQLLMIC